jgi:putative membrane protein
MLIAAFIIEYTGVKTGFPFGDYSYSPVLIPFVSGVPAAISFAWLSVVFTAYFAAVILFKKAARFSGALISSVLVLAVDMMLEPFASFINGFWIWESGFIPFRNYLSWLVIGFVFSLAVSMFISPVKLRSLSSEYIKVPFIIFAVNILNFIILNFYHGYYAETSAAALIIILLTIVIPQTVKNEA